MKLTNEQRHAIEQEIDYTLQNLPALTRLNLECTGCLLDVNQLLSSGWTHLFDDSSPNEWMMRDSVYLCYTLTHKGCIHRVFLSVGLSLGEREGKEGLFVLKNEALHRARCGEIPRLAYYRWITVVSIHRMSYVEDLQVRDLPETLIHQLRNDLKQARVKPPRRPMEDLYFQIEGYDPFMCADGDEGLSESDVMLRQLGTVLERIEDKKCNEARTRILAILFNLLFVAKSEGDRFLKGVQSPYTALMIADFTEGILSPEIALLAFKMLLPYNMGTFGYEVVDILAMLAVYLFEADCPYCAQVIIEQIEEVYRQILDLDEEILPNIHPIVKALLNYLCRNAFKTQGEMDATLECFRTLKSLPFKEGEDEDAQLQLLEAVIECFIQTKYASDRLKPALEKVFAITRQHYHAWQSALSEDEQWKRSIAASIAVPKAWQVYLACLNGTPNLALQAYPNVISQTKFHSHCFPIERVVYGLPVALLWEGIFPNLSNEERLQKLTALSSTSLTTLPSKPLCVREFYAAPIYSSIRIQKEATAQDGLSFIVVSGAQDDAETAWNVLNISPFFPTESEHFQTNIVGAIWEYFPWANNSMSEALIQLDDHAHTQLYALMPFYAEDKAYCLRGQRFKGKLCAFATEIKADTTERDDQQTITVTKGPLVEEKGNPVEVHISPDIYDYFDQDVNHEECSRAGFNLCGKILSKHTLQAFGETIACIQVSCARLPINLDLYINEALVGSDLTVGTPVHVVGWLYVDFTDPVDAAVDLINTYPAGLPLCSNYSPDIYGIPTYVRTEWTPEEESIFSLCAPRYDDYAEQYLLHCDGVEAVTRCPQNHASINFLVKQHGIIKPYSFIITEKDTSSFQATFTGRDLLLLYLKKKDRGVKLHWEIRACPSVKR